MKIVVARPPIFEAADAAFDFNISHTVFTYGDTLYNPGGIDPIFDYILAHEAVHAVQQDHSEEKAKLWWDRYLCEPAFRADQESRAYGVQYREMVKENRNREHRHKILFDLSCTLSGKLYGHCIGQDKAMKLIKLYSGV